MTAPFDLETAIATWRRSLEYHRAFLGEDVEELENHLRDHVAALVATGMAEEAAFRHARRELGDYVTTESEYRKVYWEKVTYRRTLLRELLIHAAMLQNYFKIALRNLSKHKGYTAINVFGLAVGLAATVLLLLFVRHERSYDRFHEHAAHIHRLGEHLTNANQDFTYYVTRTPALPLLIEELPEVISGTRIVGNTHWLRGTGEAIQQSITYVDSGFFDVFSFAVLHGEGAEALRQQNRVLLTASMAETLFGTDDPVGQFLELDYGRQSFQVAGVLVDPPRNSTLQFSLLASWQNVPSGWHIDRGGNWYNSNNVAYIRLAPETNLDVLHENLQAFKERHFTPYEGSTVTFVSMPLLDYRAEVSAYTETLPLLGLIAAIILLIAAINFMNLSTARSLRRAHEIGVRKVMGAVRRQLIGQFLGESVLTSLGALAVGMLLVEAALPWFNDLYNLDLTVGYGTYGYVLPLLLALGLIVGLGAGLYPALFLSSFEPIRALRGRGKKGQGAWVRQGLVVLQFALSVALMIGTLVVWEQLDFMKTQDLAFQKEQVVALRTHPSGFENPDAVSARLTSIKEALRQHPQVRQASFANDLPGLMQGSYNSYFGMDGEAETDLVRMRQVQVGEAYFETMGMTFVEGGPAVETVASERGGIVINETAKARLGWTEAVGKQLRASAGTPMEIVGVVKDYHYQSLESQIEPLIHFSLGGRVDARYLLVAFRTGPVSSHLALLREHWQTLETRRAFDYFFVDETFDSLYRSREREGQLITTFSLLALLIASLGLLGLAMFAAQQRTKEIGIRKVLGASVGGLVLLLSKDFLRLVAVAFIVGAPVAYFLLDPWLAGFAYHISLRASVFLLTLGLVVVVAGATISYHAYRAATGHPVAALRHE